MNSVLLIKLFKSRQKKDSSSASYRLLCLNFQAVELTDPVYMTYHTFSNCALSVIKKRDLLFIKYYACLSVQNGLKRLIFL